MRMPKEKRDAIAQLVKMASASLTGAFALASEDIQDNYGDTFDADLDRLMLKIRDARDAANAIKLDDL